MAIPGLAVAAQPENGVVTLLARSDGHDSGSFAKRWPYHRAASWREARPAGEISNLMQDLVEGLSPRGDPFPYDGMEQIQLRASSEWERTLRLPWFREGLTAGAGTLVDVEKSLVCRVDRHILLPGTGAYKVVIFSKRNPAMTHGEYSRYWLNEHARIIKSQGDLWSYFRGYVQNHIEEESFRTLSGRRTTDVQPFDGMIELWLDSAEAAKAAFGTFGYLNVVKSDESNFLSKGKSIAFTARERRII